MNTLTLETEIRQRLQAALQPIQLDIRDDSAQHAGHKGNNGGGHFTLHVVSARFAGHSPVARHRLVYQVLADLMPQRIHALSITAQTPDER